jgi:hypothetical protein
VKAAPELAPYAMTTRPRNSLAARLLRLLNGPTAPPAVEVVIGTPPNAAPASSRFDEILRTAIGDREN